MDVLTVIPFPDRCAPAGRKDRDWLQYRNWMIRYRATVKRSAYHWAEVATLTSFISDDTAYD